MRTAWSDPGVSSPRLKPGAPDAARYWWRMTHREQVRDLDLQRQAAMIAARQGSGCYWGNFDASPE